MDQRIADIRAQCEETPDYFSKTAYERTKICCRMLATRGDDIPSWMGIRDIIGKGSSTDINRGIRDYRAEQGVLLRKIQSAPGVPEALTPIFLGLWSEAMAEANKTFEVARNECAQQVAQAISEKNHAQLNVAALRMDLDLLKSREESYIAALRTAGHQLENERGSRAQAERLYAEQATELRNQRDRVEHLLAENKAEMRAALTRFDGERKHALAQIEEARRAADAKVTKANEQAASVQRDMELSLASAARNAEKLLVARDAAEKRAEQLVGENDQLRSRLNRAAIEKTARPDVRTTPRTVSRRKTSLNRQRKQP